MLPREIVPRQTLKTRENTCMNTHVARFAWGWGGAVTHLYYHL